MARSKNHHNQALRVLFCFNALFIFGGSMLGPLYALFVSRFEGGVLSVSLSWAAYLVAATFGTLLVGFIGDSIKEKEYMLIAGYFVRAICWLAYLFIGNMTELIIVQIGIGIGDALGTPAFDALLAEHLDKGRHIADYAQWKLISNLVLAAGTVIGGVVVAAYGFPPIFLTMSIVALIAGFGVYFKPRNLL